MERLVEYANAGLPVILFGSDIKRVYGSDRAADIEVSEMYARLAGLGNVRVVATEEEILNVLTELGVGSHAKYNIPQLEATQYNAVTTNESTFNKVAGKKIANVEEKEPIDLSGEKWKLVIHCYGPDPDSRDPGNSKVTDVDFGMQALGKWCDIQVANEQLDMLGVSDMKDVSGTGEYTISFTLPDNFGENDGAFIAYRYGRDQVGALIVNGIELPANNASDRVDVGTLLTEGRNTLTIRLNSTLYGRTYFEHSGYLDKGVVYGMGEGVLDPPVPGTYYNGLLSVSIIPYRAKTMDEYDAIEEVPATEGQSASSSATIYNLQGQRLATSQRGVNIIGGKKIIVK